ncbi:MAG: chemotaxis protein CheD [Sulfurimonas sp.]|uniref:chemotaxis protein CheD n=1 Tax=Sulfurimonas sp. TaxID=2022749 RepID=UPI002631BBD1|nr:chemotaxis protein CheD [Sulfurimonas sp.]MDD2652544.1 chemotaxis protein CheD [Sulfurimonas sp.]MDD3451281.1 chemotaxis protein CheD [Sulfurimonas sp.]
MTNLCTNFIHVGQIHVDRGSTSISTVLGSCVAVCLYDKKLCIGGMNHYLLPFWNGNGLQSLKFGNISTPKLIEAMLEQGSNIGNIEAKIFGGASIYFLNSNQNIMVGEKNILVAKEILNDYKIKIVAEDLGGTLGRKIQLNVQNGKVLLKYTAKSDF